MSCLTSLVTVPLAASWPPPPWPYPVSCNFSKDWVASASPVISCHSNQWNPIYSLIPHLIKAECHLLLIFNRTVCECHSTSIAFLRPFGSYSKPLFLWFVSCMSFKLKWPHSLRGTMPNLPSFINLLGVYLINHWNGCYSGIGNVSILVKISRGGGGLPGEGHWTFTPTGCHFFEWPACMGETSRIASPTMSSQISSVRERDISSQSSYQLRQRPQREALEGEEGAEFFILRHCSMNITITVIWAVIKRMFHFASILPLALENWKY